MGSYLYATELDRLVYQQVQKMQNVSSSYFLSRVYIISKVTRGDYVNCCGCQNKRKTCVRCLDPTGNLVTGYDINCLSFNEKGVLDHLWEVH